MHISNIALEAWKKIADVKDPSTSFSVVCQGPTEGYMPFVDRLEKAFGQH